MAAISPAQGYVSDTLYHFVARQAASDDARAEVLLTILSDKVLLSDRTGRYSQGVPLFIDDAFRTAGEISTIPAVCFCDIPFAQLAIHTRKYGRFGIGFRKHSLIAKGVRPVWYVPKNGYSAISTMETIENRFPSEFSKFFNATSTIIRTLTEGTEIVDPHNRLSDDDGVQQALSQLHMSHFFVLAEMAWFFKFFDAALPFDHDENYYMEREWRKVNGGITFSAEEVTDVVVPSKNYASLVGARLPQYAARIRVFDDGDLTLIRPTFVKANGTQRGQPLTLDKNEKDQQR